MVDAKDIWLVEKGRKMLGDLLRSKREELRFTQDDVAKLAGCSRASIAKFETGQYLPSIYLCHKLFKVLHLREFSTMTARIMAGK
jgi:DNA-binding XRE family transcriptional regulator